MTGGVTIKSKAEIEIMIEGGKKLAEIKKKLMEAVKVGVSALAIDDLAEKLIIEAGGKPSFKMVDGYRWSTCVNVNSGVVHGIPHKHIIFEKEDIVSVDVGIFYKGYHTDTSMSVYLGDEDKEKMRFLSGGREALSAGIKSVKIGNKIGDISKAIEESLNKYGYSPITTLTGHGIGKNLHESPYVPCFVSGSNDEKIEIVEGMVLAIEVMYSLGSPDLVKENDGWTLATKDGKISGLFEETVAVTSHGFLVLTNL